LIFDANLKIEAISEDFLEELEDLIEDYMVNFFLLNPHDAASLERARSLSEKVQPFYYTVPLGLEGAENEKCVGIYVNRKITPETIRKIEPPLVVDGAIMDKEMAAWLNESPKGGVVLDAPLDIVLPDRFCYGISPRSTDQNPPTLLEGLRMERMMLQSNFPENSYDAVYQAVRRVSDTLFRPEQSIIAHATQNALHCFGLR